MFEPGKKSDRAQSQERTLVIRESASSAPSTSPFQTPEEVRSFHFYVSKTADLISIYSQRHFWTTIIPQASHEHTSVKHSVLALSILHESLARTDGLTEDDNSRLFHHYNTAIRALTQSQPTTDIVLITCILFWTVENFNGAGQPSFDHMEAAQKILREFKAKANHTDSPHYTVINRYIEPIVIDGVQHARTRSVEIPEKPQEPERVPSELVDRIMPASLPTTFPNLDAASDHLRSCIQALLHVLNNDLSEDDTEILIERVEVHLQRWIYLFHSLTAAGTACNRRLLVIHHVNTTTLLAEFKQSLDIELHQEEDFKNQYTWNITEIEELLASKLESMSHLSHDLGVIPPLFTAAVRCIDPDVRTRATAVLISLSRVEGCWSDNIAACMAHTIDQARLEGNIGVKLSKITVSTSGYALSIRGTDPPFDRLVGGPEVEMEQFDMVSPCPNMFDADIIADRFIRLHSTMLFTTTVTSLTVRFEDLLDLDETNVEGQISDSRIIGYVPAVGELLRGLATR